MADILNQIFDTLTEQDWLEYTGLLFGIVYVILAANNKIICWFFGIISCLAIAIKDFVDYQLYLDGILQVFYIVMGFAGIYLWKYGNKDKQEKPVGSWSVRKHSRYLMPILIGSVIIGYNFAKYTDAQFPYLDSLTTVISIYATFLLVNRIKDNWILWIIADLIYIYLYTSREAWFFALLMIIYTIIAAFGFIKWEKEYQSQKASI